MINVLQTIFSIPYVSVDEATNKTRLLLLTFILLSVHYAQPQDRRMGETGKGRMLNT